MGRCNRRQRACRRSHLLFRRGEARDHRTEMAADHACLQSSDASPRPGALHADASRHAPERHRSAVHERSGGMSTDLMSSPDHLERQVLAAIAGAHDEAALEAVRVGALGKKGSISALLATLGKMSPEERKSEGAKINLAKDAITQALSARRELLKSAALDARLASETIDVTLPLRDPPAEASRIHPLSQVMDELTTIFADMGFAIAEGPDIETDDYNFTKLNFPEGHPAREMHDTFFFNPKPDGSRMLL